METEAILAFCDLEQRINIEFPGVRKERRPHVIRYVSEAGRPQFNLYSRLAGADDAKRRIRARESGRRPTNR
jgi:hypothetical protein